MPVPEPKSAESKADYIGRCMATPHMKKHPQKQRLAICYTTWDDSKKKSKSKPKK